MNRYYLSALFLIFLLSCTQHETSGVEVIKFDMKMIDTLKQTSDTTYTEMIGRSDFYTEDGYVNRKDHITTRVLKDSLGHVVGFNRSKEGMVTNSGEYYDNGQLKGKIQFVEGKVDGPVTYYYPDGRIKMVGQMHNDKQSGIWKKFDEQGQLEKIVHYDAHGEAAKTEVIKGD